MWKSTYQKQNEKDQKQYTHTRLDTDKDVRQL